MFHGNSTLLRVLSASAFAVLTSLMSLSTKRAMELGNRASFVLKRRNVINAELLTPARFDPLTQLANRRYCSEYYGHHVRYATRRPLDLAARHGGDEFVVLVNIGVCAGWPDAATTPDSLLDTADRALYQAKLEGRNRVVGLPLGTTQG